MSDIDGYYPKLLRALFISFLLVMVAACGGGGRGGSGITVLKPANLSYGETDQSFAVGIEIMPLTPTNTGGAVVVYSVTPDLPPGLSLDSSTGVISGTPTAARAREMYSIVGTNNAGSVTAGLNVTITASVEPPSGLVYMGCVTCTFAIGEPIMELSPNSSGGQITNYSVSPALPVGLSLDAMTGVISGTPTGAASAATSAIYTVTGTNSAGATSASFVIALQSQVIPPFIFFYFDPSYDVVIGTPIVPIVPLIIGGQITNCDVSPNLPDGLTLDPTDCAISGEPAPTNNTFPILYTFTGSNDAGSLSTDLILTVRNQLVAPSNLRYELAPFNITVNLPITTPILPRNDGGQISSYSVSPALPAGLSLNTSNGAIAGTPTALTPSATYTVTGTNDAGSTPTTFDLIVRNPQSGCLDPACDVYQSPYKTWIRTTSQKYTYLDAKNYCENTVANLLGGRWVLPNDYHLLFGWSNVADLQVVQGKNWVFGPVWFEPQDKSQIGSYNFGIELTRPFMKTDQVAPLPQSTELLVTCFQSN